MPKFVLKKNAKVRFEAPVIVREPGSGLCFDFIGIFEIVETGQPPEEVALDAFVGWRGIADESAVDNELAVTPEHREALTKLPHVRYAIVRAYVGELVRYPEKNAEPPAASGPAPTSAPTPH